MILLSLYYIIFLSILENNPNETYVQLGAFQKYILNQNALHKLDSTSCDVKCPDIKRLNECHNNFMCRETRFCKNELVGCESMNAHDASPVVCINVSTT